METDRIFLENDVFRLVIDETCAARSLILKESGTECLAGGPPVPLFSLTEARPYNNEIKLSRPTKGMTLAANRVRREGDLLVAGFELAGFEAEIRVTVRPRYLSFSLAGFRVRPEDFGNLAMTPPPVTSFRMLQLRVKERENFGEWLNVSWDRAAAVCVLGTSPFARIDSEKRTEGRLLFAESLSEFQLRSCGCALIVSGPEDLLDTVDEIEEDYDLPRGVKSRREELINASALWVDDMTPENADEYIALAKRGGFRMLLLYFSCLFEGGALSEAIGSYRLKNVYSNGASDVVAMLQKIRKAGIHPGLHFLHTHIGWDSGYLAPCADHRLHLRRHFTLAAALAGDGDGGYAVDGGGAGSNETDGRCDVAAFGENISDEGAMHAGRDIFVEQNPAGCEMHDGCRILQFGGELISYEGYTEERPYRFTGIRRGAHGTKIVPHEKGTIGGLLDVCEYGAATVYIDQETSLQDEIADRLAAVYNLGFEFVYFDGSEGTNPPFEIYVPYAQYRVYRKLDPPPLFGEGAAKAHFSWHMLGGGNAFDIFPTKVFKEMLVRHPAEEARRMAQDFTRINFGWWAFRMDTQPDQYEFGTSLAAAWDCPVTVMASKEGMQRMRAHARTPDILEVMRRWEDVRATGWLSPAQKEELKDTSREHTLLIDEEGEYELVPYERIAADGGSGAVTAYLFVRKGRTYAVVWHNTGSGTLAVPVPESVFLGSPGELSAAGSRFLYEEEPGGVRLTVEVSAGKLLLPLAGKRYFSTDLAPGAVREAFAESRLI